MNALDTPSVSWFDVERAWSLTRELTPRPRVRVAAEDAHGAVLNLYPGSGVSTTREAPARPWAMYLADSNHLFRFLCFDLDAKIHGVADVDRDMRTIRELLVDAAIPHLVCQSGPAGGRHVWIALAEGLDATVVRTLAADLEQLCKTLDKAPLSNPATGCVRPPFTPHRNGGGSTPILGAIDTLRQASVTAEQITHLASAIADRVADGDRDAPVDAHRPLPIDKHGRVYLPGSRRPLPQSSALALREDAASGDASSVLWQILLGAATARWQYADVLQLLPQPGLEHARTMRQGSTRIPRPKTGDQSPPRILARQWDKAVRLVASSTRTAGADPTFEPRAAELSCLVEALQQRAAASSGRWATGGGPVDRRVLDQLCILSLQAMNVEVEADIRRLALSCGIGRESARVALLRLEEDGWIRRIAAAEGKRAARWSIDPRSILHRSPPEARSQADPRPEGAGSVSRSRLLTALLRRSAFRAHDAFTSRAGLGISVGNVYAELHEDAHVGLEPELHTLITHGLVRHTPAGWAPSSAAMRDDVAKRIGSTGTLRARARTYWIERETWAHWNDELEWMETPTRQKWKQPPGDQQPIYTDGTTRHGRYPRSLDGRADHRAARRLAQAAFDGIRPPVEQQPAAVRFVDSAAA